VFGPDNLPPLEAMALGCPVIAADIPGAREQLGGSAILVDPYEAEGFAAAIRSLRDEPMKTDAMIARGRERARSWTAANYVSAVLDVFNTRIAPMRDLWS
jgi:glycosyltransferase involved in cell wall biosynthesis